MGEQYSPEAGRQVRHVIVTPPSGLPRGLSPVPMEPASLRPYRLLRLLGEGATARVFLAVHVTIGRCVALKLLRPDLAQQPHYRALFQFEAYAASQVRSPHVVKITDIVERPGASFMVMDYLDGHTLAEELRSGPLPLERALQIGQQLAAALEDVHQAGIVHCDLKPEHVIIQEGGRRIKLIDFGVARSSLPLEEAEAGDSSNPFSAVAVESLIVGTPRYVAPEQARGEPTSERADIYSLGVVLYQMLTGRYPYEEMDTEQLGANSPLSSRSRWDG